MDTLLRIKDVAKLLNVTPNTAYLMAQSGSIPAFKVGGSWRVKPSDLDAWIDEKASNASKSGE